MLKPWLLRKSIGPFKESQWHWFGETGWVWGTPSKERRETQSSFWTFVRHHCFMEYIYIYLCPQLFARIICRALAHIVWRKVRRLESIQSPIWNTYSTETREAKLRQCLSPTVLPFDMWRESHIFNKIVTTHNHTGEESVVVIYNLTWFSMSIMVSQCLSWSI